jgi:curli biogenesis system outer membrane secretion channel CsgG
LEAGCGYHVSGRADLLPRNIHTIAVPAFANSTMRYKLTEQLPEAIAREFLTRTRYQIVPDPGAADAVLTGTVTGYNSYPTTYDPATGRASAAQLSVVLDVTLRDQATGTVLFSRERMEFRERYEISVDQSAYFEESDAALDRLSRDVARTLVSAILEKF